jgi:hypothetical protein
MYVTEKERLEELRKVVLENTPRPDPRFLDSSRVATVIFQPSYFPSEHFLTSSADSLMEKRSHTRQSFCDVWPRSSALVLAKSRQSHVANATMVS